MEAYDAFLKASVRAGRKSALESRLDSIVIQALELDRTSVRDSMEIIERIITDELVRLGSKEPFSLILMISAQQENNLISFKASEITASEAIRAICGSTGLSYSYIGESILIKSKQ